MELKVNIYKDGQHWKTKKFKDPRTKFVRDFNSVNGQNSAVVARESIEKVQKSLWLSRYVMIPTVTAIVFLATLAGGKLIFSGQMQATAGRSDVSFFATTAEFDDPKAGDAVPIITSHSARGNVVVKNNTITLPQSDRPYIFSWDGGFDQDGNPDQLVMLGFRGVDANGVSVSALLFNDAEARYKKSSYEFQRPSAQAIFDASDGPLTVKLEIRHGATNLDVTEGWIEISQSENQMPSSL